MMLRVRTKFGEYEVRDAVATTSCRFGWVILGDYRLQGDSVWMEGLFPIKDIQRCDEVPEQLVLTQERAA